MSTSRQDDVRVFAITCGWLTADLGNFVAGADGTIKAPVPCFLIEHPKGKVLFDTGLHPDTQHDVAGRVGPLISSMFEFHYGQGEDVKARLEGLDTDAGDIDYLINSHLHFDHTGGNELVPNARVVVQRIEWEAGREPDTIARNGYNPKDYDTGHDVLTVDGEHDLFGDGTITCIPTYGHTPGHQSLRVRSASGDIVFTADACYLRRSLEEMILPSIVADPEQMRASLERLRALQAAGARMIFGHDPEMWAELPQAPQAL